MICQETKHQKIVYYLGVVCAIGIGYRSFGASLLDVFFQVVGRDDIVVLRNGNTIMSQLIGLAGLLIGAKGVDTYFMDRQNDRSRQRDPAARTRKDDRREQDEEKRSDRKTAG